MATITDNVEPVNVRRTESADAQEISNLIRPETTAMFGNINVIYLLERANLAVTVTTKKDEVLAHAAFLDYPMGDFVDQAVWESFLQQYFNAEKCTSMNTLFLHLFVAKPDVSSGTAKEIVRTVFNAITELQYILLVVPNKHGIGDLEPALVDIFEPIKSLKNTEVPFSAFVCHRHHHCPQLHVRRARVEDHDDLIQIFTEQTKALSSTYGSYFLAELIESQDQENHAAVCESDGTAVGFISVCGDINLTMLNECFELGPFNGLRKTKAETPTAEPLLQLDPLLSTPSLDATEAQKPNKEVSDCTVIDSNEECISDEELSNQLSSEQQSETEPEPKSDPPNAFRVQLFVIDKRLEMRSVDFLPYVFKQFPDRDFCIMSVPKLAPEFPLLQSFLRVAPHHTSSLPQELYIFHRAGLLKTFDVRVVVSADMPDIQSLVEQLRLHQSLAADLDCFLKARRDPDGTPLQAFVAVAQKQIIGVMIIKNEQDMEYIRANYSIESFVYFSYHRHEEHGQLCHFALNPTFQHHAKHFLKEALRLAHMSCLYYPVYPPLHKHKNSCGHYLTVALHHMVPVRPRRQIVLSLEELGTNAPSQQITKEQPPYALNHFNRKLTMEPKVTINARIVVVGASDTGLSFLEVFIFCPHLRFNNITLISTHGIPASHGAEATRFLATSHGYSSRVHAQLSLRSWINIVTGKMIAIDRASKHVLVTGGRKVPYDHLILCTGQQYQVPCPTGVDISNLAPSGGRPVQPRHERYTAPVPYNLFTLNDEFDCQAAYGWLVTNFIEQEGDAIVYGNSIDMYSCVEALLAIGVCGSRIHLVHPPTDSLESCFSDPTVGKAVTKALDKSGVHVHNSYLLAQWNDGHHPDPITSASFTSGLADGPPLRLECAVFLNLSTKNVDYDAFKSINDACLVYDGRLVIDTTFHTNDSTIRAAGPMTKFARRYHADQWSHGNFNSTEVGRQLAAVLLPFFDPTLELIGDPPVDADRLIPLYSQAKIQGARLPGGFSYLHATRPAVWLTSPRDSDGRNIITGRTETGNYFRLHLDQHSMVDAITCMSMKPLPVSNYLCLYGKHEQLLNHLCSRYDEGLVYDLYSYFRERWCLAIYHDRFPDFEEEMHHIMESTQIQLQGDAVSMPELIQRLVEAKVEITEQPEHFLKKSFEKSKGLASLKKSALNYLKYNRYHLTMYAQPGLL
ncbi:cilia- and flagella-associated protein 61 [Sardina pilchardus]|uniref:cilia- and flagella-associated protein 61 n=1 Tax=Sardina pilchardus TaxID=27697 RepID=UPI002E13F51B